MREDDHRKAAEEIERDIATLRANAGTHRAIIELAWGAGFHWVAYGSQRKHQKHRENHQGLASYLDGLNEGLVASYWRDFEQLRQGGFYGHQNDAVHVTAALNMLANLRHWATM